MSKNEDGFDEEKYFAGLPLDEVPWPIKKPVKKGLRFWCALGAHVSEYGPSKECCPDCFKEYLELRRLLFEIQKAKPHFKGYRMSVVFKSMWEHVKKGGS